jgi:hypothetical protein
MNFINAVRKTTTAYYDNHTKPIDIYTAKFKTLIFFKGLKENKNGKKFLPKEMNSCRNIKIYATLEKV